MIRPSPNPQPGEEHYWRSGARSAIAIQRCADCAVLVHPPTEMCPACRSRQREFVDVEPAGAVYAFAVNEQQWDVRMPPPYVVASVELDAQPGLRVVTNIIGCDLSEVRIGMRVRATFEPVGDWFVPVFRPDEGAMS